MVGPYLKGGGGLQGGGATTKELKRDQPSHKDTRTVGPAGLRKGPNLSRPGVVSLTGGVGAEKGGKVNRWEKNEKIGGTPTK